MLSLRFVAGTHAQLYYAIYQDQDRLRKFASQEIVITRLDDNSCHQFDGQADGSTGMNASWPGTWEAVNHPHKLLAGIGHDLQNAYVGSKVTRFAHCVKDAFKDTSA